MIQIFSDVPVPLATKIYYCQRSDLLRSDLARLYHESSSKEYCSILVGAEVVQPQDNSMMPSHASLKNYSYEQIADQPDSQVCQFSCSVEPSNPLGFVPPSDFDLINLNF